MWIFLAIATTLVVVAPTAVEVWGRSIQRSTFRSAHYRHTVSEVRLDLGSAEASVGPGPDGEARVDKRLTWALSKPSVEEVLDGNVLLITYHCHGSYPFDSLECGAVIDVQVPRGARVSAVSGSGRLTVRGITGDLDLRTGSGEITLADTRGALRARARSGTVKATGITAPTTVAEVASGVVDLRYAAPPGSVDATAASGTAKVIVPRGSRYRVQAWSGSGSSHVNRAVVDDQSAQTISVRSNSGSTYVDYEDD